MRTALGFVYLIGPPGAGKTTALTRALAPDGWTDVDVPVAHRRIGDTVWLGRARALFGGTDTLPMNVARTAESWLAARPADFIVGEGDRLAYGRLFDVAASAGYHLRIVYLHTRPEIAAGRREARALASGSRLQAETWVRGRTTKAAHLAADYGAFLLDGNQPAEQVGAEMRSELLAAGIPAQALA